VHRIFVKKENTYKDIAKGNFKTPSKIRTVISADFDNDGYDEIFLNNIGEPNKLFKIKENGELKEIDLAKKDPSGEVVLTENGKTLLSEMKLQPKVMKRNLIDTGEKPTFLDDLLGEL